MADPNQDQDDLVSQDDIDKLLSSASIEAPEESLEAVDISSDTEDMGELSQDDIDSLLGSGKPGGAPDGFEEAVSEEEEGELSQDDINSLLNSSAGDTQTSGTKETDAAENSAEDTEDDMGELSQDDIDSLLGGGVVGLEDDDQENGSRQDSSQEAEEQEDDAQEIDLIDQADIDRLLKPDPDHEPPSESPESMDAETSAQIQETKADQAAGDAFVISADQAADPADCLVTQETLDALMQNAPEPVPASDPVILDETDEVGETDQVDLDAVDLDTADWEDPLLEPKADDVTQEDIDALLQDPEEQDSESDEKGEQSQEEADEDAASEEDADDILISQDDIDTLLMAADQEDEDILGNVSGDFDDMLTDDFADEDMDDADAEQDDLKSDQVVLERSDHADVGADEDKVSGTGRKWYRSKLVPAAVSALLALAIALPAAYFLFYPKTAELPAINEQMAMAPEEIVVDVLPEQEQTQINQGVDVPMEIVDVDLTTPVPRKTSGSVVLKNFIVLSSDRSEDMAYITLDIAIDYSDRRAYDEINSNRAFFRDVIYEAIQQNLVWEKRDAVTKNDLIKGVETGLKRVLPTEYIEKIRFSAFKTS